AASLVWEANPELNYRQIIEALKSTATDLNVPGEDNETGAGLVNPDAAVAKAKQMTPEEYDPEDFSTPDTWGGEGLVTPEERAVDFYGTIQNVGDVTITGWLRVRSGPGISYAEVTTIPPGTTLTFEEQTQGEWVQDQSGLGGSDIWYSLADGSGWMSGLYIGNIQQIELVDDGSGTPIEDPIVGEQPTPSQDGLEWELYEVQDGDSLWDIAKARTGDGNNYLLIFNYPDNSGKIATPDEIYSGQQIWVPKGGSSSIGDSSSPVYAPRFETYHLFEGAYDEFPWIGSPIGDPYISSSGFVSQEFENAHLIYNGADVVSVEKKVEGTPFVPVPDNEPVLSGKGSLIRTGGVDIGVQNHYQHPSSYTGLVWTDIYFEASNVGKKHFVTINWGQYKWQKEIIPDAPGGVVRFEYTKTNQDAYPIIVTVSAMPNELNGAKHITNNTSFNHGNYSGKGNLIGGVSHKLEDATNGWVEDLSIPSVSPSHYPDMEFVLNAYFENKDNTKNEEWTHKEIEEKWDRVGGSNGQYGKYTEWKYVVEGEWQSEMPGDILKVYEDLSTTVVGSAKKVTVGYAYDEGYHPVYGAHSGIDIDTVDGDLIQSATKGEVSFVGNYNAIRDQFGNLIDYGWWIAVDELSSDNKRTGRRWWYGHLNSSFVKAGDPLNPNQKIGYAGDGTGLKHHLHLLVVNTYDAPPNSWYPETSNGGTKDYKNDVADVTNRTVSPLHAYWKSKNGIKE
ncbi:MAG: peptidoglycan DD-metalloendopeptidase family protein, partial [Planktothrix sp.]